ncbi:hypothetical protein EV126DRAFT_93023 [Verticillium dahliae]|nr:hypothetical protein EV126DRAFT_93023 [Verticillium dahliae]
MMTCLVMFYVLSCSALSQGAPASWPLWVSCSLVSCHSASTRRHHLLIGPREAGDGQLKRMTWPRWQMMWCCHFGHVPPHAATFDLRPSTLDPRPSTLNPRLLSRPDAPGSAHADKLVRGFPLLPLYRTSHGYTSNLADSGT